MKDKKYYTCPYCFKEYEPKRRRVQVYCSNTCRAKAYHARKPKGFTTKATDPAVSLEEPPTLSSKIKIETVSAAGIGNATFGSLAADGIKALFTKEENKPATKGDLMKLAELINGRYHVIMNLPKRFGKTPYFDMETNTIEYLNV